MAGWESNMSLHLLDSALFANSQAFLKAYFYYILFLMYPFIFEIVHCYVDKTESLLTCHIFFKLLFCRQFWRQNACRRQHYGSVFEMRLSSPTLPQVLLKIRAVVFQLFQKTVILPPNPVGFRLTYTQLSRHIFLSDIISICLN